MPGVGESQRGWEIGEIEAGMELEGEGREMSKDANKGLGEAQLL